MLAGCAAEREVPVVNEQAVIPRYEETRLNGDVAPDRIGDLLAALATQAKARAEAEGAMPNSGRFDVLVLSGGSS